MTAAQFRRTVVGYTACLGTGGYMRAAGQAVGPKWPWSTDPAKAWIFATRDEAFAWLALRGLAPRLNRTRRVTRPAARPARDGGRGK